MISNQRDLIEDLERSNQDYTRKFESLKLGIEDKSRAQENCSQKDESSKKMSSPLQEQPQVNVHGTGQRKRHEAQKVPAPHMGTDDIFLSTNVQNLPRNLEIQDTKPRQEMQENDRVEDEFFSNLKHYLSLVNNLIDEVGEPKYDIRIDSRDRVKGQILQTYEREMDLLDTPDQNIWGLMAAKPIAPLVESLQKHLHRAQQQQSQHLIKYREHEDNKSQKVPQADHTGLDDPQSYVDQPKMIQKYNFAPDQAAAMAIADSPRQGQQSHGYEIVHSSTAGSPRMEEIVMKNELTPRSPQVSPNLGLARDSTLVDFTTETLHSPPIEKERRGNGCLTCCARQMVCDEGLPICQNCIQSGSRCEDDGPCDSVSLGVIDSASPEEGDKSPHPLASDHRVSTGGPSEPSLARSPDPEEKERNSHGLPDRQPSNLQPPLVPTPRPSSPIRNPIPSITPSSPPGEVGDSQGQQTHRQRQYKNRLSR